MEAGEGGEEVAGAAVRKDSAAHMWTRSLLVQSVQPHGDQRRSFFFFKSRSHV